MSPATKRARIGERLRAAAGGERRLRIAVSVGAVLTALLAAGALALVFGTRAFESPPPDVDRLSSTPPIRLDTMPTPRGGPDDDEGRGKGDAPTPVIGVGTGEFAAPEEPATIDVDGKAKSTEPPSDAVVRRELAALERENARIEAALRGGGGAAIGTGRLIWPVRGGVTSPFGMRWGRLHAGVDIGVGSGTPVRAADAGRVVVLGPTGGYGNYICIQHTRSLTTCYAHLSAFGVRRGESVRQGQVIARSGCTGRCYGPHLHFETRVNGKPVDPMRYL